MVSFRSLAAGVALTAAHVMAVFTPAQLTAGLNQLASKSQALQSTANGITLINAPLIIIGLGPFPVYCPLYAVTCLLTR